MHPRFPLVRSKEVCTGSYLAIVIFSRIRQLHDERVIRRIDRDGVVVLANRIRARRGRRAVRLDVGLRREERRAVNRRRAVVEPITLGEFPELQGRVVGRVQDKGETPWDAVELARNELKDLEPGP